MIIVEAINSAPNEHAVYFLLTAYVESLRHFERASGVPEAVLRLPIAGRGDLTARLETVNDTIEVPLEAAVPALEVAAVLASAVTRLARLDSPDRSRDGALLRAA